MKVKTGELAERLSISRSHLVRIIESEAFKIPGMRTSKSGHRWWLDTPNFKRWITLFRLNTNRRARLISKAYQVYKKAVEMPVDSQKYEKLDSEMEKAMPAMSKHRRQFKPNVCDFGFAVNAVYRYVEFWDNLVPIEDWPVKQLETVHKELRSIERLLARIRKTRQQSKP